MGYPHPDYLLEELTSEQLSEWEAYDRIDPIGMWRVDFNFATLKSLLVNIAQAQNRRKGEQLNPVAPIDFMPDWSGELAEMKKRERQSPEEMKSLLLSFARSHNERLKKEEERKIRTDPPKVGRRKEK